MMKKRMKILAAILLLPLALCLSAGAAEAVEFGAPFCSK